MEGLYNNEFNAINYKPYEPLLSIQESKGELKINDPFSDVYMVIKLRMKRKHIFSIPSFAKVIIHNPNEWKLLCMIWFVLIPDLMNYESLAMYIQSF